MSDAPLAPVVLGHNAFFGVNHLSHRRGAEQAASLGRDESVIALVEAARRMGVRGLMLSTHPRAARLATALRLRNDLSAELLVYPLLPYAQKYVLRANEMGMVRAALHTLREASFRQRIGLGTDAIRLIVRRDATDLLRALIRVELGVFHRLQVHVVFLHDALADLLFALDLPDVYGVYADCLRRQLGVEVGLATKNLPFALDRFTRWGVPPPHLLTHVNRVGFQMNPHQAQCEQLLASGEISVMAMGSLASGHLSPTQGLPYLKNFPAVKSVCIGTSTVAHLEEMVDLLTSMPESRTSPNGAHGRGRSACQSSWAR